MEAAKLIPIRGDSEPGYQLRPGAHGRVKGNGRAIAVAKFRELADLLERGVLDGARVQWLDTHDLRVERIGADGKVRELALDDLGDRRDGDKPISGLEFVTRTAWSDDGSGQVQMISTTIEEV